MTLNELKVFIEDAIQNITDNNYFSREAGERGFCYEFYHQIKLLWTETGFAENIVLSSEIKKATHNTHLYPDFVIHEFHSYYHQMVAFEVKNNFSTNILRKDNNISFIRKDIEKLISYQQPIAQHGLNYSVGIFMAINTEPEDMDAYRAALDGLEFLDEHALIDIFENIAIENLGNTKLIFAMFRHTNGTIEWINVRNWLEGNNN